ncbi:MAG: DUF5667 domain-containing protein [bacterium]
MIKKLLLGIFLSMFLFTGMVQAQISELPEPGVLPDSPFYFVKSWTEGIGTLFTFGDVAKAERFINLSEKRLAEAEALVEKGKPEIAERAIGRYQEHLDRALTKAEEAKTKGLDTDEVLAKVAEATLKHQAVLADVYEKVPEQAKSAIERAMQAGMRGYEEALKAVSGQKREGVMEQVEQKRQEIEQRIEGLRDKGIPIPTIPTKKEIEKRIPVRPETQEPEVEKSEAQEVESETPGGAGKPETGKP